MRGLAVGLVVTAACTDLFGPDSIARPRLRLLAIDGLSSTLRHGGVLFVHGYPADTSFRLSSNQQVRLEITATSGDRESAGLRRRHCPHRERGPHFLCHRFLVVLQSGHDASSIADHVAAVGGRFSLVSSSGTLAEVTLFSPDDLVQRARDARSWRGVAYTELLFPFCAPDTPGCLSLSQLVVPVPVDSGAAVPDDGIVQVRSGDTVMVVYRQPTGELVQAQRAVP